MKKFQFFAVLFIVQFAGFGQAISLDDQNLKIALVNTICANTGGGNYATGDADTNNDGEVDINEAQAITVLSLNNQNISSLAGIESFTNLVSLTCNDNQITSFGLQLPHLNSLECRNNNLSQLSITGLPFLYVLDFSYNPIENIILQDNSLLHDLYCSHTLLSEINLCGTSVSWFFCDHNPNLTYISSKNDVISVVLGARSNAEGTPPPVSQFDFSACPQLETICYDEGELQAVNWTIDQNPNNINRVTDCALDCVLGRDRFETANFTLAPNPVGNMLQIYSGNTIYSVEIFNMLGQVVKVISLKDNQHFVIADVSELKAATYFAEVKSGNDKTTQKFIKL